MENVQHAVLRSSLPFSTPLRPTRPTIYLSARRCHAMPSYQMIGTGQREEEPLGVEAVENPPQRPHQYCSLTWWKRTPANIFHHVIEREDQMPWLDMPTLLPVQMVTQSLLHYSWISLKRRWRSLKRLESRGCSRVQLSTSRSCLLSDEKLWSRRKNANSSSSWCNRQARLMQMCQFFRRTPQSNEFWMPQMIKALTLGDTNLIHFITMSLGLFSKNYSIGQKSEIML